MFVFLQVGNMFVSEEGGRGPQLRGNNPALLALYEAVHLNRNFVAVLAHAQTDAAPPVGVAGGNTPGDSSSSSSSPAHLVAQPSTLLGTFFQYWSVFSFRNT